MATTRTVRALIAVVIACASTAWGEETAKTTEGVLSEDYHLIEDFPTSGHLTLMSRWIDTDELAAAIVFKVDEQGRLASVARHKGELILLRRMVDSFCRSAYAYYMVSDLMTKIPEVYGRDKISEADFFSFLPYVYFERSNPFGTQSYANLPAYCHHHSTVFKERMKRERLVVLDLHGPDDQLKEGYLVEFTEGLTSSERYLLRIQRLEGTDAVPFYPEEGTGE